MPVIKTYASTPIPADARESLKASWGKAIEAVPGKSEQWLMCIFEENVAMYHAGSDAEPAAFVTVDVFARGEVDAGAWEQMTPQICSALERELGIDPSRIYVRYAAGSNFGWNNMNF